MNQNNQEPKPKVPFTKSPLFIPAIVLIIVVVIIFIFVQSKNKTPKLVTTASTTTTGVTTPIHAVTSTITLPPTTIINTEKVTVTVPASTTETKTALVTSTVPVTSTDVVTSTTTVTNTLPPVTTTINAGLTTTTTIPVTVTTTLPVTTTITITTPTLTFNTGLAVDGNTLVGQNLKSGFTIITGGNASISHILTLSGQLISSPLATYIPFTLQATSPEKTALLSYFNTMGGNVIYQTQIDNQVNGTVPYFYLNTSNDLVDGFKYALGITPTTFIINDDYPKGTYLYTGTLIGSNNAILPLTITLIVK